MKNPMIAAVVALLCAGAFADTFYVDANYGNDAWDGTTVKCTLKTDGKVSFKVVPDGEGTVTVMFGETELTPVGNTYTFDGAVGENAVTITYAGDGKSVVSGFVLPGLGLLLFVR